MTNKKASAVEFFNVTKKFDEAIAVNDVSFKVEAGHLATLLGPSGCGKTTTLRMIAGLEMATSGMITIGDKEVTKLSTVDRDVTMVFQSYALFPHMNVMDNVSYGLLSNKIPKEQAIEISNKWLAMVGLTGYEKRLPSELSGGQQQRVAVARALVMEPEVLLFDEPLSNLDAKLRRKMREDIRDLQQNLGITTVYVTHDQEEALAISDKIIIMDRSVIAQEGTPSELYDNPQNIFVANFMGDANLLKANVRNIDARDAEIEINGFKKILPHRGIKSLTAIFAIRPESVRLGKEKGEFAGKIKRRSYLGNHMEYTLESAVGDLFVVDDNVEYPYEVNETVGCSLLAKGISLIKDSD